MDAELLLTASTVLAITYLIGAIALLRCAALRDRRLRSHWMLLVIPVLGTTVLLIQIQLCLAQDGDKHDCAT